MCGRVAHKSSILKGDVEEHFLKIVVIDVSAQTPTSRPTNQFRIMAKDIVLIEGQAPRISDARYAASRERAGNVSRARSCDQASLKCKTLSHPMVA